MLLKKKKVKEEDLQKEIMEYSIFLSQLDILNQNDQDREFLKLLMDVVNIFFKYNL